MFLGYTVCCKVSSQMLLWCGKSQYYFKCTAQHEVDEKNSSYTRLETNAYLPGRGWSLLHVVNLDKHGSYSGNKPLNVNIFHLPCLKCCGWAFLFRDGSVGPTPASQPSEKHYDAWSLVYNTWTRASEQLYGIFIDAEYWSWRHLVLMYVLKQLVNWCENLKNESLFCCKAAVE